MSTTVSLFRVIAREHVGDKSKILYVKFGMRVDDRTVFSVQVPRLIVALINHFVK